MTDNKAQANIDEDHLDSRKPFKHAKRKYTRYIVSDQARDAFGIDKSFHKQRLLDKLKIAGTTAQEQTDLLLFDNPEKTKRFILKNFFRFYLKNILTQNSILTESYLGALRTHYDSLN
jgi:hypothetical protein